MNFNYDKVKKLSNEDLSNIMFQILMGTNIVQKGRKFSNEGEDPRSIPAYMELLEDIKSQVEPGSERPITNLMEFLNLEIQFEADRRAEISKPHFDEIHIESRVNGLFQSSRRFENETQIHF